jgi:hypothetical protein
MPLWFILTTNIYWLFWLHKTYKEIRAHTPTATDVTPGKAVRYIQPLALGLWLGATGAQLAASLTYRVGNFIEVRVREQSPISFHLDPWDVATDLLFAVVFAFAFWGGLALMAPRVLRD